MTEALTQQIVAGRYQVQRTLGRGGMAIVSLAEDVLLGRQVALKTLLPAFAYDRAFVERFRREAQAAARLGHPNIVRIYDLLQSAEGSPVIVMEHVAGPSLQDALRRTGPPPLWVAVSLVRQAAAALEEAHRSGLVHRDIKPANLLLTSPIPNDDWDALPADIPQVKVVDFGIARAAGERSLSMAGEVWGSAHYLSPEQARGEAATAESDVYALGCVLFELLTGQPPFQGESGMAVALQHIESAPPSPRSFEPTLPPSLDYVVLRALAKDPGQRFPSAREFGDALRQVEEMGFEATGPLPVLAPRSPSRPGTSRQAAPRTQSQTTSRQSRAASRYVEESEQPRVAVLPWLLGIPLLIGLIGALAWVGVQFLPRATTTQTESPEAPVIQLPASVTVPQLIGRTFEEARAQLEGLGLAVKEGDKLFSNTDAAGVVMQQNPAANSTLRPGEVVTLAVSQGPDKVSLPSVVGKTFGEAQAQLEALGLTVEKKDSPRTGARQEEVIGQEPSAGTQVPKGQTVALQVNPGGLVQVPLVYGKLEAEAKRIIEAAGLSVSPWPNYQSRGNSDIKPEILDRVCRGCVLSASNEGQAVAPSTVISLAVRHPADS